MPRKSVKKNKKPYQLAREDLGLTREKASEILRGISEDRLEKLENKDQLIPHPEEVDTMAEAYKCPSLRNYYCAHDCPLGQKFVPKIEVKELSQITLEMLATLNTLNSQKDRLIEITVDGEVSDEEELDFNAIQDNLENMSMAIDALKLWAAETAAKKDK